MYSNEHTLQDLLRQAYRRLDMDAAADAVAVRQAYGRVVGDFIGRLTRSVAFSAGTLTVSLASAALRQELFLRRTSLAESINQSVGRPLVKKIVFI